MHHSFKDEVLEPQGEIDVTLSNKTIIQDRLI